MKARRIVTRNPIKASALLLVLSTLMISSADGQNPAPPTAPAPLGIPMPGPVTDQPYAPQPILQGGIVVTLFPPGSKYLKADKVRAHGWVETGDGYYIYFLRALENLLREKSIIDAPTLESKMREITDAGHEDHEH